MPDLVAAGPLPGYAETTGLAPPDASALWLEQAELAVERAVNRVIAARASADHEAAEQAGADAVRATMQRSRAYLQVRAYARFIAAQRASSSS